MKITRKQLSKIIQEAKKSLFEGNAGPGIHSMIIHDVDTGGKYGASVIGEHDMVTVIFGSSFSVHLSASDAQELGAAIVEAGTMIEDDDAGRNPGGSIG